MPCRIKQRYKLRTAKLCVDVYKRQAFIIAQGIVQFLNFFEGVCFRRSTKKGLRIKKARCFSANFLLRMGFSFFRLQRILDRQMNLADPLAFH